MTFRFSMIATGVLGAWALCANGCSSTSTGGAVDAGANDDAVAEAAAAAPDDASASCKAPDGPTCPPTAGNCKGIGVPCTKGGGECAAAGNQCDVDLDPRGSGTCISVLGCTPGSCGSGATCCKTPTTSNAAVCFPDQCLPSDCTPDP